MNITVSEESAARIRVIIDRAWREPFSRRTWAELGYFLVSGAVATVGFALVTVLMTIGTILAITFVGLAVLALSVRVARGIGGWQRGFVRSLLAEQIEDPEPYMARPGFLGWLQSSLRDRVGWRAAGCQALQLAWAFVGALVALSLWWDAFACLLHPLLGRQGGGPAMWGLAQSIFPLGRNWWVETDFARQFAIFVLGIVFLLAAPWVTRGFVHVDRVLVRKLLGPDPVAARMRSLERARTDTVDASAATLRRIERDLHDGTQAQLVALAMRLGMVKEKLQDPNAADLAAVRRLVDDAHRGAKEAIVELRDIARGIHPPVLDTGLERALATLAARSPVPTEVSVELTARPTPAVESIVYFCAAELLANVAQHAWASRATLSCTQHGGWLRLVVRDDGRGGAAVAGYGSRSSGLAGLTDRVRAVDGQLYLVSPPGGPTVVTVDVPMGP